MKFTAVYLGVALSQLGNVVLLRQATSEDPITAAVQPFVASHSLAGAVVLVANRDKILALGAVGYADIAANKPMATNDLFWIASQSKPIAATAIMILSDEGKLRLDDPVAKYLPEFNHLWLRVEQTDGTLVLRRPQHPVTIRQILSHTGGLPPISPVEGPTLDLMPLRDAVLSYSMNPLNFEPGAKYEYSNAGINTAGRIVEVVSGMSYEKFLRERLFGPLDMRNTTFRPTKRQIATLAKSYRPNARKDDLEETPISQVKYPLDDPGRYPFPAGGLFSTATDYAHFCEMILGGGIYRGKRIVSEAAVQEMTRKQTGDSIPTNYGLGWSTGETFGHGGAYSTNFVIDPKQGLIFIWMVQQAGYANNGAESFNAFLRAARAQFALPRK